MSTTTDDITAAAICAIFIIIGLIDICQSRGKRHRAGWIITGIAAIMVGVVYSFPVVFRVPVVEAREALRTALIAYGANYIILHADVFGAMIRRAKQWKYHRS